MVLRGALDGVVLGGDGPRAPMADNDTMLAPAAPSNSRRSDPGVARSTTLLSGVAALPAARMAPFVAVMTTRYHPRASAASRTIASATTVPSCWFAHARRLSSESSGGVGTRSRPKAWRAATAAVKAATAPVAWFDPPRDLPELAKGDDVTVVGHVRRRFFQAGGGLQSRTEVVADVVVPSRNARRARTAVERALARARPE